MDFLSKLPPEKSTIQELHRILDTQVKKQDARALVVTPSSFYDWIVSPLCEVLKKGKIYLIKSPGGQKPLMHDNLILLDSAAEELAFKDNFFDFVRLHGEPQDVDSTLRELHRVLKKDGSLALIVPYYKQLEDSPYLTIGEYVEKMEHQFSESDTRTTRLDYHNAKSVLSYYFHTLEEHRLAHLVIFIAHHKCDLPKF
jgi:SAM-dependent methyltransferase